MRVDDVVGNVLQALGGERYTFGRKKMLLRQMQITVFHGLEPIAVFTEKTTAKNLAGQDDTCLPRPPSRFKRSRPSFTL